MNYSTYLKYIFNVKIQLFVRQSLTRIHIRIRICRIGLAPWNRIRIEVKRWIRIRNEINADPQNGRTAKNSKLVETEAKAGRKSTLIIIGYRPS
jgi:hypothetical protein